MWCDVAELVTEVRVVLDQNNSSTALSSLSDVDTLTLEELIESKLCDAVRVVESSASWHLLDCGEPFGESIGWDSAPGYGSGHVALPDDFLRLVVFKMSDWSYGVTAPIGEDSAEYPLQWSRYPGIRGCPQRPVVAIVQRPVGLVLEFFSCTSGEDAYIERARYIPQPAIVSGQLSVSAKLRRASVYYAGYLVALAIRDADQAAALRAVAVRLAEMEEETDS